MLYGWRYSYIAHFLSSRTIIIASHIWQSPDGKSWTLIGHRKSPCPRWSKPFPTAAAHKRSSWRHTLPPHQVITTAGAAAHITNISKRFNIWISPNSSNVYPWIKTLQRPLSTVRRRWRVNSRLSYCPPLHKGANNVIKYTTTPLRLCTAGHYSPDSSGGMRKEKSRTGRWDYIYSCFLFCMLFHSSSSARPGEFGVGHTFGPVSRPEDLALNAETWKMERKKDFSIARILGDGSDSPQREDNRPEEAEVEGRSSCDDDEDDLHNPVDIESGGRNFPDPVAATSWLHSNYGCPPFFNRGWFSQTIRPPFFTLQGFYRSIRIQYI